MGRENIATQIDSIYKGGIELHNQQVEENRYAEMCLELGAGMCPTYLNVTTSSRNKRQRDIHSQRAVKLYIINNTK